MKATLPLAPHASNALVLRGALGLLFLAAGFAKLFALDATAQIVAEHGILLPNVVALLVGVGETVGGLLLLAGLHVRGVAQTLLVAVVLAAVLVHDPFGLPPGVAHMDAIALVLDIVVVAGLASLARATR